LAAVRPFLSAGIKYRIVGHWSNRFCHHNQEASQTSDGYVATTNMDSS
jgi:hypothetical protein